MNFTKWTLKRATNDWPAKVVCIFLAWGVWALMKNEIEPKEKIKVEPTTPVSEKKDGEI